MSLAKTRMRRDRGDGEVVMSGMDILRDGPIIGDGTHLQQPSIPTQMLREKEDK